MVWLLMIIWGTFGVWVSRRGRCVSRVTTAVLTSVVVGVLSMGLSVLLIVGLVLVDFLPIVDGK